MRFLRFQTHEASQKQIGVDYSLFEQTLSDLFGILAEIKHRMNNNPV
ncbi:MAG: hypothetical protein WB586_18770 [Chthoniobacterales bacterium]